MKYYLVHDILCAAMRKGLVLSLPVILLSGGEWMRGDDSVGSRGKVEVNVDQQSLNETRGAPLINSFDSSISY